MKETRRKMSGNESRKEAKTEDKGRERERGREGGRSSHPFPGWIFMKRGYQTESVLYAPV